jgi:hypothetical protein
MTHNIFIYLNFSKNSDGYEELNHDRISKYL